MIGRGRLGTGVIGGGRRIDNVSVNAETAEAFTEMGLPLAYNGLVRAGYAAARASVLQAFVRTQVGTIRPYSTRVPSSTQRVWNGRAWVPVLVDQWANDQKVWDGSQWVDPPRETLPRQRVWNGESWVP